MVFIFGIEKYVGIEMDKNVVGEFWQDFKKSFAEICMVYYWFIAKGETFREITDRKINFLHNGILRDLY